MCVCVFSIYTDHVSCFTSYDKCAYCKLLWIKAYKCPKCQCKCKCILSLIFRVKGDEGRWASSLPSIPNPFPELCSPPQSPVVIGSVPPSASDKHVCLFIFCWAACHCYYYISRKTKIHELICSNNIKSNASTSIVLFGRTVIQKAS